MACRQIISGFLSSLLQIVGEMSPYLLLGFLVAGILHVWVPGRFYSRYLAADDWKSVLRAALLGIPLPLCSCGVVPAAVGLRNEGASKGAVASFLIATPQTGVDSIIATFSLMGMAFAVVRPVTALLTAICGGLLVSRFCRNAAASAPVAGAAVPLKQRRRPLWSVLRYALVDMMQNIGPRLLLGLLLAAFIQVAVPDSFFLQFGSRPLLQMLIMLLIAVPMYVCSTGSIPIAAALLAKGMSPGAALVLLMAGPAVNLGAVLVVRKTMGRRFTGIYLLSITAGAVLFGLLLNLVDGLLHFTHSAAAHCCATAAPQPPGLFKIICGTILTLCLFNVFIMKHFNKFHRTAPTPASCVYRVDGMHCNHCKAAVENAVGKIPGVTSAVADLDRNSVIVEGTASESDVRQAVEQAGFTFKGCQPQQ
ncbi:MAG: permease [bacterium P3]|nr:MAG: permease [bacterium P3]KWW40393.1 MAG: permease [bacterium F083]